MDHKGSKAVVCQRGPKHACEHRSLCCGLDPTERSQTDTPRLGIQQSCSGRCRRVQYRKAKVPGVPTPRGSGLSSSYPSKLNTASRIDFESYLFRSRICLDEFLLSALPDRGGPYPPGLSSIRPKESLGSRSPGRPRELAVADPGALKRSP